MLFLYGGLKAIFFPFFPVVTKFFSSRVWLKPREMPRIIFKSLLAHFQEHLDVDPAWAALYHHVLKINILPCPSGQIWKSNFFSLPQVTAPAAVFLGCLVENDFHIWNKRPNKSNFLFSGRVNALTSFTSIHLNLNIIFLVTCTEGLSICEMSLFPPSQFCSFWQS